MLDSSLISNPNTESHPRVRVKAHRPSRGRPSNGVGIRSSYLTNCIHEHERIRCTALLLTSCQGMIRPAWSGTAELWTLTARLSACARHDALRDLNTRQSIHRRAMGDISIRSHRCRQQRNARTTTTNFFRHISKQRHALLQQKPN